MQEKADLELAQHRQPSSRQRPTALTLALGAALVLQIIGGTEWSSLPRWLAQPTKAAPAQNAPLAPGISWTACPDLTETFCSFLSVPLDYTDVKPEETVSLALRMIPSTAPVSEQLGYLFTNPGGPGGSGHQFVARAGLQLSKIVQGRYHIISWDPRSVNLTSPALSCFPTLGDQARFTRDVEHLGSLPRSGIKADELAWASKVDSYSRAVDEACQSSDERSRAMMRASTTAFVARDIKRIMEALGETSLSYVGFSYGTILGATFSAMFPELVGRVWLDGVSDSESYTNNMWSWGRAGMNDTHKTYEGFLSSCAESGPEGCALAHSESTGKELGRRVQGLMDKLDIAPLPVGRSTVGPGVVTSGSVQLAIFRGLYAPKSWPKLAQALASAEQGNGTGLFELTESGNNDLSRDKDPLDNAFHRQMGSGGESTAAIMCADTDHSKLNDTSVSTFHTYARELARISPTGAQWATWVGQCRHFKSAEKPSEVYRGPWTREDGLRKTAYPVVFFSQTADPVTPLVSAQKMRDGFGSDSARLLMQDGFGHCSLAHPSLCTARSMRAYFINGTLPEDGKLCESDPGFLFPREGDVVAEVAAEDVELSEAMRALADEVPTGRSRGP